ncbi:MAG: hypothetical protein GHCLOJNM_01009 [bacterium]|nr:hypothetical protein [bacterium]
MTFPTQSEMVRWIEEVVSFGTRRPGSPADLRTEEYIAQLYASFGLERVEKEPVPVNCCRSDRAELALPDGSRVPACSVPYTAWTPAAGIEAPCVLLGSGTPEEIADAEVRGKIVVVEARFADFSAAFLKQHATHIHDTDNTIPDGILHKANWLITNFSAYYAAHARGAVALVGILVDAPIDGCEYWVPYDGFLKDLPAVWVGREQADTLRSPAHCGERLTLFSVGETRRIESHNVVGWVPGRGDEIVVVTCHHDAPFASAVEDASGLAVLLALAKHFGAFPRTLERSLVFVASSGHFHGGDGNRVFVETHREDLLPRIVAALGVEHFANEVESGPDGKYRLTGLPEVRALFCDSQALSARLAELLKPGVLERGLILPPYIFGPEPPCDSAPFFTAGIPSLCHISGPLYLFDPEDTLDKVRVEDLVPAVGVFSELIRGIDATPAAELERGLARKRTDPPAAPPHWFLPPEDYLKRMGAHG